jgi:2-amino-4-hydroxy-6-hydroxymethyldihydropteridine diphosphokinase
VAPSPIALSRVALSLGGNVGPVRDRLVDALLALADFLAPPSPHPASTLLVSPLYRTAPVSPIAQPDYLNAAAVGRTGRSAREILAFGQELERRAGRRPGPRDGPRPLDVDLLIHGDAVVASAELTLPHPRLAERAFVLVPLAAIAPGLPVPPSGATVAELLARLGPIAGVERVPWGEAEARRLGLDPAAESGAA